MAEYTGCDDCRHSDKGMRDFPCTVCIHNAIDKFAPKTNADRIRSMSDEEMAEWLTKVTNDAQRDSITKCDYQWGEWLKSEAKE